jgi:hypothetical protein
MLDIETKRLRRKMKEIDHIPCPKRRFPYRISFLTFYASYLRWLKHLMERLGDQSILLLWKETFTDYDDQILLNILSSGWHEVETDETHQVEATAEAWIDDFLSSSGFELSSAEVRNIIENTPPITQIKQLFSIKTVEKEISAYDALHIRFDGFACLAEALIDKYGKQGELIIYDLMTEGRLASGQGETGSVEEFIESFTSASDTPNLFTTGLEIEVISKSAREAVAFVRECEWARYFQERHPQVGYLMACSTDEVSYRAFNPSLRLQRTGTIMEGSDQCDFRIYAVAEKQ